MLNLIHQFFDANYYQLIYLTLGFNLCIILEFDSYFFMKLYLMLGNNL